MAKNPVIIPQLVQFNRQYVLEGIQGVVLETFDRRTAVSTVTPTASGQFRLSATPALQGDHINSMGIYCDTSAGVGVSLLKLAALDEVGTLLGVTADLSGQLATQTWIKGDFAGGTVVIPANGLVWLGMLAVYATTAPSFRGATTPGSNWAALPTGRNMELTYSGQSDITGNYNIASAGVGTQQYYIMAY